MSEDTLTTCLTSEKHSISAWVTVDGIRSPVYGITTVGKITSGFIESKDGAEFAVTILNDQQSATTDRVIRLIMDGTEVNAFITSKDDAYYKTAKGDSSRKLRVAGTPIADKLERPFVFAKPCLTDDDEIACQEESIIKNLGTIQINIHRASEGTVVETPGYVLPQEIIIDERVKKATLSHQIGFKEAVAINPQSRYTVTFIDPKNSPQFIFEFKYLSRALLELKGFNLPPPQAEERQISPTPPAQNGPSSVSNYDKEEDDDDEEDEACLARLEADVQLAEAKKAVLEQKAKMAKKKLQGKRNSQDNGNGTNKKVKVEGGGQVKKEAGGRDLGMVVFTDDSDED